MAVIQTGRYSEIYCRQSGERLGECFPQKTKGGAVRSKSDIYSLVLGNKKMKIENICRQHHEGIGTR